MESRERDYRRRVREGFSAEALPNPDRIAVIDACIQAADAAALDAAR